MFTHSFQGEMQPPQSPQEIEPISVIAGRLVVGPEFGQIVIDGRQSQLPPELFRTLHFMAQQPDELITYPDFASGLFGYANLSVFSMDYIKKATMDHVKSLRPRLGTDLGDPTFGVIKTHYGQGLILKSEL